MSTTEAVAIIGAGPYGLSIAAHLNRQRTPFRIFGPTMESWRRMPKGMLLKSEGCASSLADPDGFHTLERYCAESGAPYRPWGAPVPRDLFVRYAFWFQSRLVQNLDERRVKKCGRSGAWFELEIEDGERLRARSVIVATGISRAERMPQELAHLPRGLVSHSSDHPDLSVFKDRNVVVLGAGQSAIETAALLCEVGANTRLVARGETLRWNPDANLPRTLYQRIRHPMTPLGPGLRNAFYIYSPQLFRLLPESVRTREVKLALGPAGAWWLRPRFDCIVPVVLGRHLYSAHVVGEKVELILATEDGRRESITADHVIAATGYQVTKASLASLASPLVDEIQWESHGPKLNHRFESTVAGLYFVGLASAYTYGPSMRFVAGAKYTSRTLARHIVRQEAARSSIGKGADYSATRNHLQSLRSARPRSDNVNG